MNPVPTVRKMRMVLPPDRKVLANYIFLHGNGRSGAKSLHKPLVVFPVDHLKFRIGVFSGEAAGQFRFFLFVVLEFNGAQLAVGFLQQVYFLLCMGGSFIDKEMKEYVAQNLVMMLALLTSGAALILLILQYLFRVNVFRVIVIYGT